MRWSACLCAVALCACALSEDGRSPEAIRATLEAQNVYPANYRAEIIAYLRTYLNDPTGVRDALISEPALRPLGPTPRYVACVRFNAKKVTGGYAGNKDHLASFLSGKLDRFVEVKGEPCNAAAYVAFPELGRLTR